MLRTGLLCLAGCALLAAGQEVDGVLAPVGLSLSTATKETSSGVVSFPDADYVKVHISALELGEGDVLVVSDPSGDDVQEFKESDMDKEDGVWAFTIDGDKAIVTIKQTPANAESGLIATVTISEAYHGVHDKVEKRSIAKLLSICQRNQLQEAACWKSSHPTEYSKARAVAKLRLGGSVCTAWRVAGRPDTMITNNHCISNSGQLRSSEVEFMFENSRCRGNDARRQRVRVRLSQLLATDRGLDMTLFTIQDPSRVAQFGALQLDVRAPRRGEQIYIPQHPAGRDKEIAINSDRGVCTVRQTSYRGGRDISYQCDTEGGSSGSPVLSSSSHKVIGLHHLGGCDNAGVRVDRFFSKVSRFLNGGGNTGGGNTGGGSTPSVTPTPPRGGCPAARTACGYCYRTSRQAASARRRCAAPAPTPRPTPQPPTNSRCPRGYNFIGCGYCWRSRNDAYYGGCR